MEKRLYCRHVPSGERVSWSDFLDRFKPGRGAPDELWEADYDYAFIRRKFGTGLPVRDAPGIFKWWPLLPVAGPAGLVSLGEGGTPLIHCRQFERRNHPRVLVKNESVNPTGSFKDRYDCLSVNVARALGYSRVVCASTGNHALAVAAYAAAAGLDCLSIVADSISDQVRATLKVYGAATRVVPAADRFEMLAEEASSGRFPMGLFMPGATGNPFGVEAYKTIAYELLDQLGHAPDAVVFPCARGNGLYGTWKGFREAYELGLINRLPRMYACQPDSAASLVKAFEAGAHTPVHVTPGTTIADAVNESISSVQALEALYASNGGAVAIDDNAIFDAMFALGRDGVFAEASSAMARAAVERLADAGAFTRGETVVMVVTSTGFKSTREILEQIAAER